MKHAQDYEDLLARGEVAKAEVVELDEDPRPDSERDRPISCLFCPSAFEAQPELQTHVSLVHSGKQHDSNLSAKIVESAQPEEKKKKRRSLMDKINQLTANATSVNNLFSRLQPH